MSQCSRPWTDPEIAWLETREEQLALRLLTYLDGIPLNEADYLAPTVRYVGWACSPA